MTSERIDELICDAGRAAIEEHRESTKHVLFGGREAIIFSVRIFAGLGDDFPATVFTTTAFANRTNAIEEACAEVLALARRFDPQAQSGGELLDNDRGHEKPADDESAGDDDDQSGDARQPAVKSEETDTGQAPEATTDKTPRGK
jgi:hypothetical protein